MKAKTYESMQGLGKTGQTLENFGEEQNQFNAEIIKQMRIAELQMNMLTRKLTETMEEVEKLKETQVKLILRMTKCEAEIEILKQDNASAALDVLRQEVDRLKLTAKLNTNAIERLTHAK